MERKQYRARDKKNNRIIYSENYKNYWQFRKDVEGMEVDENYEMGYRRKPTSLYENDYVKSLRDWFIGVLRKSNDKWYIDVGELWMIDVEESFMFRKSFGIDITVIGNTHQHNLWDFRIHDKKDD